MDLFSIPLHCHFSLVLLCYVMILSLSLTVRSSPFSFAHLPRHQTLSSESMTLSPRTITTKYGQIRGNLVKLSALSSRRSVKSQSSPPPPLELSDVEAFLGVPYATPPTGGLRFMPPVTPTHWRGVRLASKSSPVCPQRIPELELAAVAARTGNESATLRHMTRARFEYLRRLIPLLGNQSEDCLYLNIYVPVRPGKSTGKYKDFQLF